MAFPATYGQGVTNPDTCPGATPVAETGVTDPANDDPSSFAAGCGAHAGTDGSVAIGDKAEVKKYQVSSTQPPIPDITWMDKGGGAIAIGNKARVLGEESIAIGAKTEVRWIKEGIVRFKGTLKIGSAAPQNVIIERSNGTLKVYKADEDWNWNVEDDPIEVPKAAPEVSVTLTETAERSPDSFLPVTRAVAVGADVKVTGDNAVAIGAGASAKANSIAIGADVEAGEKEIVIGNGNATKVEVGGMDLMGIDKNVTGNRTDIDANAGNITTNVGNITTNSAHISTNAGNIATNTDNIVTNVGNITTNSAHISTNAGNIATNTDNIVTNVGNITTNSAHISTNAGNIATNTDNIVTNVGNITTNSAHISTNAGNIATNTDNIVTNSSNINVNARDILNNKAGIAMAIALAHIPAATGGSRGSVGIGGGFFDGKEAIAIGASFRVGDRGQAKLGISHSSGETGGGVGVGFNF